MRRLSISHQQNDNNFPGRSRGDVDDQSAAESLLSSRRSSHPQQRKKNVASLQHVPDEWDTEVVDDDDDDGSLLSRSNHEARSILSTSTSNDSSYRSRFRKKNQFHISDDHTIEEEYNGGDDDETYDTRDSPIPQQHRTHRSTLNQSLMQPHQQHPEMQKRRRATESSINHSSNTYSGLQRKRSSFGQFMKNNTTSKRDPDNNLRASTGSSGITTKGVLNNDLLSMMPGVQNELRQSQRAQEDGKLARRHSMIDPRRMSGGRGFVRKFLERQWSSSRSGSGSSSSNTSGGSKSSRGSKSRSRFRRKRWGDNATMMSASTGTEGGGISVESSQVSSHPRAAKESITPTKAHGVGNMTTVSKQDSEWNYETTNVKNSKEEVKADPAAIVSENTLQRKSTIYSTYGNEITKNRGNFTDSSEFSAVIIVDAVGNIMDASGHTYNTLNTRASSCGTNDSNHNVIPEDMSGVTGLSTPFKESVAREGSLYTTCPTQLNDQPLLDTASSQMYDMCSQFITYDQQKNESSNIPHSNSQRSGGGLSSDGELGPSSTSSMEPALPTCQPFPQDILQIIRLLPGNGCCVDCATDSANSNGKPFMWACVSYGTMLCDGCAMRHITKAEVHQNKKMKEITTVKSLEYGKWSFMEVLTMLEGGNRRMIDYFLTHDRSHQRRSSSDYKSHRNIDQEQEHMCFLPGDDEIAKNREFDIKYMSKIAMTYRRLLAQRVLEVFDAHNKDEEDEKMEMPLSGSGRGRSSSLS